MHYRPLSETFHDFLVILLQETFGRDWIEQQNALAIEQRHVVARWLEVFRNRLESPLRVGTHAYVASGSMRALMALAYDLYFLQLVNKLPSSLIERLRNPVAFQGSRYEVAIASIFARADFEIEMLDEAVKKAKHCEFIAKHRSSGIEVYVETKSRVRRGVLNEGGIFDETKDMKGDVRGLYQSALTQAPADHPFFVFIDANLPTDNLPPPEMPSRAIGLDQVPWMVEIETMLKDDWAIEGRGKSRETAVVITNFAPHFGEEDAAAPLDVFAIFPSPNPRNPLVDVHVMDDLFYCLRRYSTIPKEI